MFIREICGSLFPFTVLRSVSLGCGSRLCCDPRELKDVDGEGFGEKSVELQKNLTKNLWIISLLQRAYEAADNEHPFVVVYVVVRLQQGVVSQPTRSFTGTAGIVQEPSAEQFEAELMSRALDLSKQGNVALGSLYDLTAGRILRYAYFLTRTRDEAEDVLQASFLRLARHPGKLCRADHPWAYLLKLVRNEAYTLLYRKKPLELLTTIPCLPDARQVPGDAWERMESVRAALKTLPSVQAEVITLKIWEGLTFREIAEVTGETLPAVTSRYRYGLQKLAEELKSHGLTPAESSLRVPFR